MKRTMGVLFCGVMLAGGIACAKAPDAEPALASAQARPQADAEEGTMNKKILVAYYSYSGNTAAVARQIARQTGGTLFEITTDHAYPSAYRPMTEQAKKEIQDGFLPALSSSVPDMAQYDMVFVGSPDWWGTYAPAVRSFLAAYDFKGKTVVPFFTNGGGGMQNCESDMKKQLAGVNVAEGITFPGRSSGAPEKALSAWLQQVQTGENK